MSVNCGMCGWPGGGHEDACPEKDPENKDLMRHGKRVLKQVKQERT
jgi:hypothetical protein